MINQFKAVIQNKNLYREIEIPFDNVLYSIGTGIECNYRLRKELFFEDIRLDFINNNNNWSVMCSDNLYITVGDARKLLTKQIRHGEKMIIKYQQSNNNVFELEFKVDFDSDDKKFERKIELGNLSNISIGADINNSIVLRSQYIYGDQLELIRCSAGFNLSIRNTTYGVYHNGNRAINNEVIKNGDFFSVSDFAFYFKDNALWTEIRDDCAISRLEYKDYIVMNNYPRFKRNTRVQKVVDESDIQILDPPAKPTKPQNHIIMSLLPSLGMLIASGAMAFMGGSMIIFSVISGVMAVITTVVGLVQGNKDYKKQVSERIEKYNTYIQNKENEIKKARGKEKETLENIYVSKQEELKRFEIFSPDLFDRRPSDDDFLSVRVGNGKIEALRKINYKKQEKLEIEDNLQEIPEKLCGKYEYMDDVPVICQLREINALGIVGNDKYRYELMKSMVTDIIARQFYTDVQIFLIVDEIHSNIVSNFRFLPYLNNQEKNLRNVACDEESRKQIFEYLYNELSVREQNKDAEYVSLVLFFYDLCGFMQHPISRFVDKAKDLNVTFVFFGEERADIPMGCDKLINILDENKAQIYDAGDMTNVTEFVYDRVTDNAIGRISQRLASVETDEISLEGSLTKNINLFTLLNIFGVEDLDLKKRWSSTKVYKSMAVPLGVSKTGVVYLDLHDKAHGPHGLVAGTTGSGKSEILQTYILSIATYFHPYEVAFVIIDFKGGGMVNQFRDLPHLLGAITNIDGKEIDRSLKSIKAELQKRQRLFAENDVNHIDKYIMKFKSGEAKEPLPHLIIIVDEFAELKAEQPDFMKELISAARIGRSLGVHLILATQKPAGQVDDQIWSNSRFKLCLKVQGPEDSNEVLKSPLAAEIKEPGRAYLQVGNNEIFELFQSAYSGDSEKAVDNFVKPFSVAEVEPSGKRHLIFEQKKQSSEEKGRTQLDAIVEYVHEYCSNAKIAKLPNICLPSLQKRVLFDTKKLDLENDLMDIGLYDDPDNQYQGATYIDINTKNTFVVGSSQYGKTNFLQLLIREIALKYTPSEANIYIIDFGSMVLKVFEKLNHVGGVVCSSDDEKLKNLFKLLNEEIEKRKEKIVSVGVSSFNAYLAAGYKDLPHIYVMVDNMTALMELYLENDDSFLVIIREGVSVGITVSVVNSQTTGINYRYLSNFANKLTLHCNDSNEYSGLLDYSAIKPDDIPGRASVEINKRYLETQMYLAFDGDEEYERSKEILAFIEERNTIAPDLKARSIPYIPNVLTNRMLEKEYEVSLDQYKLPIGLSYSEVSPFYMNFAQLGAIGLCGGEKRGHYNFIANLLHQLDQRNDSYPCKVYIFDDVTRKYKSLSELSIVKKYTLDVEEIESILMGWRALLENRYQAMLDETEAYDNSLLMLIIQNNEVAKYISEDMDLNNFYTEMLEKYRALNVCVIFANYSNTAISYEAPEPIREIKKNRHFIYFDDLDNLKVCDVNYDYIRAYKKKLSVGDAYYIDDNSLIKLRLVKDE